MERENYTDLPCAYRMKTHMWGPKMKFLMNKGIRVKGIQNTARSKSLTARFNKNTLVTVLIRLLRIKVKITNRFPVTAKMKIVPEITIKTSTGKLPFLPPTVKFVELLALEDSGYSVELCISKSGQLMTSLKA